jgi:diadenosine tetraphosphate (Ap4A) HIT family hydrolase
MKSEKADGMIIVQNNGRASHQVIFRFHVHIIPEFEEPDLHTSRETPEQSELEKVATKIRKFA